MSNSLQVHEGDRLSLPTHARLRCIWQDTSAHAPAHALSAHIHKSFGPPPQAYPSAASAQLSRGTGHLFHHSKDTFTAGNFAFAVVVSPYFAKAVPRSWRDSRQGVLQNESSLRKKLPPLAGKGPAKPTKLQMLRQKYLSLWCPVRWTPTKSRKGIRNQELGSS